MEVAVSAAADLKRAHLELGGKAPAVVFADADMDTCVERSMWAVFANTGQDCCARSRIFVERPAYDGFLEALATKTDALRVGQPLSEETDLGPLVSAGQRQTSLDYLEIGQKEGARLVTGGEVPFRSLVANLACGEEPAWNRREKLILSALAERRLRGAAGFAEPRNQSLNCTMPALVKSRVGSPWGTSGALGNGRCPRSWKNWRKLPRISALFMSL